MPAQHWTLNAAGRWQTEGGRSISFRDNLVAGSYRPSAATTGTLGSLTTHAGDFVTTSASQVVQNLNITGRVKIRHDNVTFRNCRIQGGNPTVEAGFCSVEAFQSRGTTTKFYDCEITTSYLQIESGNSIQGRDFEIYRCNLWGSVDGVGAQYSNVTISACWIHDIKWYTPDPGHSDNRTHNDGIQVHGGANFTIIGNSIEVGYPGGGDGVGFHEHTSGIIVTQDVGATSNVTIDKNWIYSVSNVGTAVGINLSHSPRSGPYGGTVTVTNNRFSALSTFRTGKHILMDSTTYDKATKTGNVIDASGVAATISRNSGA